ncbi:MAG: transposase [bacterium]
MARLARVVIPCYPHHITQRGVRSMNIFTNDADRIAYLKTLKKLGENSGVTFLAYCLMRNHVHLIAIPESEQSLAKGIGEAHKHYTRMFNFRAGAKGYLFQGRFFSCPLDNRHAFAAIAYVERNPVRAGLVKHAWDYPWSSAGFHTGHSTEDMLVSKSDLLAEISNWKDFLMTEPAESEILRKTVRSGRPCGGENFVKTAEKLTRRILHPLPAGRPFKIISVMSPD